MASFDTSTPPTPPTPPRPSPVSYINEISKVYYSYENCVVLANKLFCFPLSFVIVYIRVFRSGLEAGLCPGRLTYLSMRARVQQVHQCSVSRWPFCPQAIFHTGTPPSLFLSFSRTRLTPQRTDGLVAGPVTRGVSTGGSVRHVPATVVLLQQCRWLHEPSPSDGGGLLLRVSYPFLKLFFFFVAVVLSLFWVPPSPPPPLELCCLPSDCVRFLPCLLG